MALGAQLAALPPAAIASRLAALRWTELRVDLASHLPRSGYGSLKLHRDDDCEVGLFFVPAGQRIPLHDHPDIHVWMRVLVGQLQVTSFTWTERPLARRTGDASLGPDAPVWLVEPGRDNLHQLVARSDVAFLDVLRPPYIDHRVCTHYDATPVGDDLWRMTALP